MALIRQFKWILVCMLMALSFSFSKNTKPNPHHREIKTIIIDAGHGRMPDGNFNGAKGSYSTEDEIALSIAKKLVDEIKAQMPDVAVYETRKDESIVSLNERARIANEKKGDLFVSIHVNAVKKKYSKKFIGYKMKTVYVKVGRGRNRKTVPRTKKVKDYELTEIPSQIQGTLTLVYTPRKTSDKENAVEINGEAFEYEQEDSTFKIDDDSPEVKAAKALYAKNYFLKSVKLAGIVEEEMAKNGRPSYGVTQRQKGVRVLEATNMPSILVETGFITNKEDEDYLNSEKGQKEIVEAITRALIRYKNESVQAK